ncbi:hypothetical protein [Streptomyces sp. NPDC059080]|uniref:hypothetical protein n=1 Tax=Streptomyces sp. NPDC059080 TaxID=3346718 RepID=UPI0036C6A1B3
MARNEVAAPASSIPISSEAVVGDSEEILASRTESGSEFTTLVPETEVWSLPDLGPFWPVSNSSLVDEPGTQSGRPPVEAMVPKISGSPSLYPTLEQCQTLLAERGPMRMRELLSAFGLPYTGTTVPSMHAKLRRWISEGNLHKPDRGLFAARSTPTNVVR